MIFTASTTRSLYVHLPPSLVPVAPVTPLHLLHGLQLHRQRLFTSSTASSCTDSASSPSARPPAAPPAPPATRLRSPARGRHPLTVTATAAPCRALLTARCRTIPSAPRTIRSRCMVGGPWQAPHCSANTPVITAPGSAGSTYRPRQPAGHRPPLTVSCGCRGDSATTRTVQTYMCMYGYTVM